MLSFKKNPFLLALLLFMVQFFYQFIVKYLNLSESLGWLDTLFQWSIPILFGFLYSLIFKEKIYDISFKIAGYFFFLDFLLLTIYLIMNRFEIEIPKSADLSTPTVFMFIFQFILINLGSKLYFYVKKKI